LQYKIKKLWNEQKQKLIQSLGEEFSIDNLFEEDWALNLEKISQSSISMYEFLWKLIESDILKETNEIQSLINKLKQSENINMIFFNPSTWDYQAEEVKWWIGFDEYWTSTEQLRILEENFGMTKIQENDDYHIYNDGNWFFLPTTNELVRIWSSMD